MTRRYRTRLAATMLSAFLLAWVLPVQSCVAAVPKYSSCPHCPAPCCPHGCCPDRAATCASKLDAAAATASCYYTLIVPALLPDHVPRIHTEMIDGKLREHPPSPPLVSLNVRYCRFLQ